MRGRKWTLRTPFAEMRVELLSFPSHDRAACRESERELQMLLWRAHEPEVRRVLEQVHDELRGNGVPSLHGRGPDFAQVLERDLRFEAYSGGLKVERVERVRVVPPVVDQAPEEVLGPAPPDSSKPTWFSLKVLDEVGAPVDGLDIAYSIGTQRRVVTTNGAGVARLDGVDAGSVASAGIASLAAASTKLAPRWSQPRDPKIPTGDGVTVNDLHDAANALSLQAETPATLVLTPYFRCNEIAGTHFAFGRSFVRSSALDLLAELAEALSGDDGRKGMIFGHTDLSGPQALNKELSERRAKAIYALLTQDSGMWEELYSGSADGPNWQEKWDLEEAQHMLNALGCTDDDGNALDEDGKRGPKTIQAIHRFQAGNYPDCPAEQAPLATSDYLGVSGRKELFLAYAKRVSRKPVDPARLGQVGSAKYMGCGEYNPLSLTVKDEESRRTVVFVYDPACEPQGLPCQLQSISPCQGQCGPLPKVADPDGKPPYRCAVYQKVAKRCPCQPGPDLSHDLLVRLLLSVKEADGLPHSFVLESDDGTISQKLSASSAARATGAAYAELEYKTLPEIHQYQLRCEGVAEPYIVFPFTPYDQINLLSNPVVPPQMPSLLQAEVQGGGAAVVPANGTETS